MLDPYDPSDVQVDQLGRIVLCGLCGDPFKQTESAGFFGSKNGLPIFVHDECALKEKEKAL